MELEELLRDPPKFHTDSKGNPVSWQLDEDVLRYINETITSQSKTLETGAGISTILFALKQSCHTCVVPDLSQIQKIKIYCEKNFIDTTNLHFAEGCSEKVLPGLEETGYDLVLIDGRHAFPSPFMDWYYTTPKLKVGGIMIIDDTHLWTGDVLLNFLAMEPEWEMTKSFPRSAAFIKLNDGSHGKEWVHQPFLIKKSSSGIRKEQFRFILDQIRKGDLSTLLQHLRMRK